MQSCHLKYSDLNFFNWVFWLSWQVCVTNFRFYREKTNKFYYLQHKLKNKEICLNFLDITINNNKERFEFDVYGKPALANVQIKTCSSTATTTIINILKWLHANATKISFEKILSGKVDYLTHMFCGNGYELKPLTKEIWQLWK